VLTSPSGGPQIGQVVVSQQAYTASIDKAIEDYLRNHNFPASYADAIARLRQIPVSRAGFAEFLHVTGVAPIDFAVIAFNVPLGSYMATAFAPNHEIGGAAVGDTKMTDRFNGATKDTFTNLDLGVVGVNIDGFNAMHASAETRQLMPGEPLMVLTASQIVIGQQNEHHLNRMVMLPLPPGAAHGMYNIQRCPCVFDLCQNLPSRMISDWNPLTRVDVSRTPNPSAAFTAGLISKLGQPISYTSQGYRSFTFPAPGEPWAHTLAGMGVQTLILEMM
jgi:hypothetical protein